MERNTSYPLSSEEILQHNEIASTTTITKYCTLSDDGILTIHNHKRYTDTLNKYWHSRMKSIDLTIPTVVDLSKYLTSGMVK